MSYIDEDGRLHYGETDEEITRLKSELAAAITERDAAIKAKEEAEANAASWESQHSDRVNDVVDIAADRDAALAYAGELRAALEDAIDDQRDVLSDLQEKWGNFRKERQIHQAECIANSEKALAITPPAALADRDRRIRNEAIDSVIAKLLELGALGDGNYIIALHWMKEKN